MGDVTLHGVLNMPPELWSESVLDKGQRYSRYMQASRQIEDLERMLEEANKKISAEDWISVDSALPAVGVVVLTVGSHQQPITMYLMDNEDPAGWYSYETDEYLVGITHWKSINLPVA